MAELIFTAITSLDGYVVDADGAFDWAEPDDEEHAVVNDLERSVGTYLLGRRLYEVMSYWETADTLPDRPAVEQDFTRVWQAADKVVFSRTLQAVSTARTRLERDLDLGALRRMVMSAERDVSIGGPTLAADAIRAGLVDRYHLFVHPVVVGGGTAALPHGARVDLDLLDEHRFASGVVHLHYLARR
jgi:dihydrofolate reductase